VAGLQVHGSQDIALLTVLVLDQGDVGGAVGIVLQVDDGSGAVLVPLEVDDAVLLLVAAAAVADGDAAVAVAAGGLPGVLKVNSVRLRSGLAFLSMPSKALTVMWRREGVVGL